MSGEAVEQSVENDAVVLEVGMSSSKCQACRRNADPSEAVHVVEMLPDLTFIDLSGGGDSDA